MKQLLIIRHAKSSWDQEGLHDIERPLTERGEKDAAMMGKILLKQGKMPQTIISSPALRAFSTARIISDEIHFDKHKLIISNELYFGDQESIIELIRSLSNEIDMAFIVGHNPTFSYMAASLCGDFHQELPTCGIVAIDFHAGSWKLVEKNGGKLGSYDYPGKYR